MFLILIGIFIVTFIIILNWQKHNYWESRGVFTPSYLPIVGHLYHLLLKPFRWEYTDQVYVQNKSKGFWGMYEVFSPTIVVADPELIRHVLVKDAEYFVDRRSFTMSEKDKYSNEMLTNVKGEKWKGLRSIITPTFTSGKIKSMFPLIIDKGDEMVSFCRDQMNENSFIDMRSAFGLYTMDVIATCAFGIDAHCLKNKKSDFVKYAADIVKIGFNRLIKFFILIATPKLYHVLNLEFVGESQKFFVDVAEKTIAERKKSGIKRGDFLDLMLEAFEESKEKEDYKYPMTLTTVISESMLFLVAGYDTTANTLSFTSYLLAKNPECQSRLREELQKIVETDRELTYQNVMEAKYLDACISECLRIYSVAHFTERCCTRPYRMPGTDLEIPVGTMVTIPIWSIHRDPDYWEEPLKFLPDRFLPENKENIKPYTYLPFGLGPRNCIGMRFAQLEAKVALAKLCLKFEMCLQPGYESLTFDGGPSTLRPGKDGVRLILKEIESLTDGVTDIK